MNTVRPFAAVLVSAFAASACAFEGAEEDTASISSDAKVPAACMEPVWAGLSDHPRGTMIFDHRRGRLVSFSNEGTREFVGGAWSAPSGDPLPPGLRSAPAVAYDSDRGRVVLFGDFRTSGSTWEWDSATMKWTSMASPVAPFTPAQRALAYDRARKRTVFYGYYGGGPVGHDQQTWTWDGRTWTMVANKSAPRPELMLSLNMAYDAARKKVVLYGAALLSSPFLAGTTWEWDGTQWARMAVDRFSPNGGDPGMLSRPMAFDTRKGRLLRLDLGNPSSGGGENRLLVRAWDGKAWNLVSRDWPAPSMSDDARVTLQGAFDASRSRFVIANDSIGGSHEFFDSRVAGPELFLTHQGFTKEEEVRVVAGNPVEIRLETSPQPAWEPQRPVTFGMTPLPRGATFDARSGVLTWTPTVAQVGSYALTAKVDNGCTTTKMAANIKIQPQFSGLPLGAVKLSGPVPMPVQVDDFHHAEPVISCTVAGTNPGPVTVSCVGPRTKALSWNPRVDPMYFTMPPVTATLDAEMKFRSSVPNGRNPTFFMGRLEPLADGTVRLFISKYEYESPERIRVVSRAPGYTGSDATGVLKPEP